MQRISDEQNAIARNVYHSGKAYDVTGIRGCAPRRVHAGMDASAWSKPKLIVYGKLTNKTAVAELAAGWNGDVEYKP